MLKNKITLLIYDEDYIVAISKIAKDFSKEMFVQEVFDLYGYKIGLQYIDWTPKPRILNENIFFNISNKKDYVVIIVSKYDCGIDIEFLDKRIQFSKLSSKVFCLEENNYIGNDIHKFYEVWTKKEAYFKKIGTGWTKESKKINVLKYSKIFSFEYLNYIISISF